MPLSSEIGLVALLTLAAGVRAQTSAPVKSVALRCDGVGMPLALDDRTPEFTWQYQAAGAQPAKLLGTRVTVSRMPGSGTTRPAVVWHSSWLPGTPFSVRYAGPALSPATRYQWQVQAEAADHSVIDLGSAATFRTVAGPWTAQWIQAPWSTPRDGAELDDSHPMPVFRREFALRAQPVEATLRIAGLGQYEAQLNHSEPLAAGAFRQAWTDYRKTVTYDTYDVLDQLHSGKNVLAVLLGNGMYNVQSTKGRYTKFQGSFGAPKLIAELRVQYASGNVEILGSDASWQVAHGPILFSSVYGGEDFDARRWPALWDSVGVTGPAWLPATLATSPGGRLLPAIAPMVTTQSEHKALGERALSPTRTVYDMGQNLAGWPTLEVEGPAGAILRLTAGELLNADGTVSQASTGGPQWWAYTLRGGAHEQWTPRFSYMGYRYLQADWVQPGSTGTVASPADAKTTGRVVHITSNQLSSDSAVVGSFSSSNQLLNRIHSLIVWAMRNNEVSLFTDCPHRERLGWLEQTHLVASSLLFNNDLQRLYGATEQNIADAQAPDGSVPTIAPQYTKFGPSYAVYDDSPEWGSAAILAPWAAYRFGGDKAVLQANYPVMQRYLHYLQSKATDGIVAYGLGDWYDIGPGGPGMEKDTSLGVTGTLMLYQDATTMAAIARVLGFAADARQDAELAEAEKAAFQRRFWKPAEGYYDTGSQTANAMPLSLGIVPERDQPRVLAHVLADLHAHDDHITTGEVGYPYLLRELLSTGHSDFLLRMALKTDPPSYGSQLERGATALTEAWDANPKNSQDHFMLGGVEEWFYRGLGGLDIDMSRTVAAERISIRPQIVKGLTWVHSGYDSVLGRVESDWEQTDDQVSMTITVPFGTEAVVYVPTVNSPVLVGNVPAAEAVGVRPQGHTGEASVFQVSSGTYLFRYALAHP